MHRILFLVVASLLLLSCSDGECVPFEGRVYNWDKVSSLAIGASTSELRQTLGEPVSVTHVSSADDDWRFFYRCKRTLAVSVLGISMRSGQEMSHSEAIVRVRHGRVSKILKNDGWVTE